MFLSWTNSILLESSGFQGDCNSIRVEHLGADSWLATRTEWIFGWSSTRSELEPFLCSVTQTEWLFNLWSHGSVRFPEYHPMFVFMSFYAHFTCFLYTFWINSLNSKQSCNWSKTIDLDKSSPRLHTLYDQLNLSKHEFVNNLFFSLFQIFLDEYTLKAIRSNLVYQLSILHLNIHFFFISFFISLSKTSQMWILPLNKYWRIYI